MESPIKTPKPGDLLVDVTALQEKLVDLPEGGTKGLSREKDGCDEAIAEIVANQPTFGAKAGISETDLASLTEMNAVITQIDKQLPAVEKLVELLQESRIYYEDKRERLIKLLVAAIISRSEQTKDSELLARYQKTREYYSRIGKKAAQTRAKRAKEAPIQE